MENKGRGIFYGVIGVATLVVAIIGATFAYFSATTNSAENAVAAGSTTLSLSLTDDRDMIKNDLIPVDETMAGFATDAKVDNADGSVLGCKDDNGNSYCSVYQFTVTNPSTTTAQRVYASIQVTSNTFPNNDDKGITLTGEHAMYADTSNIGIAVFKGAYDDVEALVTAGTKDWKVDDTAVTSLSGTANDALYNLVGVNGDLVVSRIAVPSTLAANGDAVTGVTYKASALAKRDTNGDIIAEDNTIWSTDLDNLEQVIPTEGSITYTVLIWLHETEQNQNYDQGQSFAAQIHFTTESGSGGVTAVISADSN